MAYFLGNRNSPWLVVALGMIGDSLSGVTFISLPGTVQAASFSYMQLVLGYLLGYFIISRVLLPVYYRLQLTSIYSYLLGRFGQNAQKTGSFFFLISRIAGAALRLFLAAGVIQTFVFDPMGVPFWLSVSCIIALMMMYTYRGGIKTLVWTDMFQSSLLLLGVFLSIYAIVGQMNWSLTEAYQQVRSSELSRVFFWDWREKNFFIKQFLSGAFIAVVMTGLDQNMMQKNLSCRSLHDAQKNVETFGFILLVVNLFFLSLGALLYLYAAQQAIVLPFDPESGKLISDKVFPYLALNHLGGFAAIAFITGLTAATFNSADSVLTTLTTSFCIDFLGFESKERTEKEKTRLRHGVHVAFALVLLLTILLAQFMPRTSVIDAIFTAAAYTYGPLLGLFAFGLFTPWRVQDRLVPWVAALPPILCYFINENSETWLNGYKFSYELLLVNGLLTFAGLMLIRLPRLPNTHKEHA